MPRIGIPSGWAIRAPRSSVPSPPIVISSCASSSSQADGVDSAATSSGPRSHSATRMLRPAASSPTARAAAYLRENGAVVALVKPQFEAGRERIGGGGVVRDPAVHGAVLREVRDAVRRAGLRVTGAALSPLRGPAGNVEFFYLLRRDGDEVGDAELDALVTAAHAERTDG